MTNDEGSEFLKNFEGSFLRPEIFFGNYVSVETTHGTEVLSTDYPVGAHPSTLEFEDRLEGHCYPKGGRTAVCQGYLARMSAPGYTDCTSYSVHQTKEGAMRCLVEMFGNDNDN